MPATNFSVPEKYIYQNGFRTYFESEAVEAALPVAINSPQNPAYGLYTERISGSSFTAPRGKSLQTFMYRIVPSVHHFGFEGQSQLPSCPKVVEAIPVPYQVKWNPIEIEQDADWILGMHLLAGAGNPAMKTGVGYYAYTCGKDMPPNEAFCSSDGDFLIVPQMGTLDIRTELGNLLVRAGEIAILPRGVRYQVKLTTGPARGFILELYEGNFELPALGPLGSSSLANERDFQTPVAAFEETTGIEWKVTIKFNNMNYSLTQNHTPFDIVAWHGTYYPYKYDLGRFSVIGSTSYDHPDPSIFTVLTAPSAIPGTAVADFIILPPRWQVMEGTFWPPYYHRNTMSEFSGLLGSAFDGKYGPESSAGAATLHNAMTSHGPDKGSYEYAKRSNLKPSKTPKDAMIFMFESSLMIGVTEWGFRHRAIQAGGAKEHLGLNSNFHVPVGKKRFSSVL